MEEIQTRMRDLGEFIREQRSVGRLSRYVLEVPGGWAARTGIRAGVKVALDVPASGR